MLWVMCPHVVNHLSAIVSALVVNVMSNLSDINYGPVYMESGNCSVVMVPASESEQNATVSHSFSLISFPSSTLNTIYRNIEYNI